MVFGMSSVIATRPCGETTIHRLVPSLVRENVQNLVEFFLYSVDAKFGNQFPGQHSRLCERGTVQNQAARAYTITKVFHRDALPRYLLSR